MPDLAERLRTDQVAARKARDKDRTLVLGTVLAALKNREIEIGHAPADADVVELLRKQIKQRQDSVTQYRTGHRDDLAAKEEFEIGVLHAYLPADVSPDVIREAAARAVADGAHDLKTLMAALLAQFRGRADGKTINQIAREILTPK